MSSTSTLAPPDTQTIRVQALRTGHYVWSDSEDRAGYRKVVRVEPWGGVDGTLSRWTTVTYSDGGTEHRQRYASTEVWAAGPRPRY